MIIQVNLPIALIILTTLLISLPLPITPFTLLSHRLTATSQSSTTSLHITPPPTSTTTTPSTTIPRRTFLLTTLTTTTSLLLPPPPADAAVQRAIGGAEAECRVRNDCLEKFELDGAVGWNWGGKDRCDPTDPTCGPDGKRAEGGRPVAAVPSDGPPGEEGSSSSRPTTMATVTLRIGKGSDAETGVLRMGLYGEDHPALVTTLVSFLSGEGLVTDDSVVTGGGYGGRGYSSPVRLAKGGAMNLLIPGERLDFGVDSQATAYARSRGLRTVGDDFVPQPRPKKVTATTATVGRRHDAAGLISLPKDGLGYGGSGFETDDEAYESGFQITAGVVPAMDREGRVVVGRLMDEESMRVLGRLASLPTKKGIKGVIPGQNYGPPFLRVQVTDVTVEPLKRV